MVSYDAVAGFSMPEAAFDRTIFRRGDVVYGYDIYAHIARRATVRVVHVTESEKGINVRYCLDPADGVVERGKKIRKFPEGGMLHEQHVFDNEGDAEAYAAAKRVEYGENDA